MIYTAQADDNSDTSGGITYSFYNDTVSYIPPPLINSSQHLYISQTNLLENDTKLSTTVSYDSLEEETTGLGLRIHFNSSELTLSALSNAFGTDLIFTDDSTTADTDDFDNNVNTDVYIEAGWASLYGIGLLKVCRQIFIF